MDKSKEREIVKVLKKVNEQIIELDSRLKKIFIAYFKMKEQQLRNHAGSK